tara:strand:- start:3709 stop:4407 length:699 start_codon:yes stop_codon:yes gene_type:complete
MAYYSRTEFAELAGLKSVKSLNAYVSRGNVIASGKFIDSEILENKEWLYKQQVKRGIIEEEIVHVPKPIKQKPVAKVVVPKKEVPIKSEKVAKVVKDFVAPLPPETDPDRMTKAEIDTAIKLAELKKKIADAQYSEIKVSKARGEVIPTDLVNSLIREMSESMKIAYMDGIENFTVVVARQKKMSVDEEANIKSHFTGLINDILKRQTFVAKKGLKNIIAAYQEVRGKGESK